MRVYSILSAIIAICGGILLLTALLSGGAFILSLNERLQHGPGLLFADVELSGLVAFICALSGGFAIFGAKKLAKRKQL